MDHVTRGNFTANRRVGFLAPSLEDVAASLSPVHLDPWSARPDVGHTVVTGSYLDIRIEERHQVRSAVKPGVVVQVCGPPMVGKATIVQQAINEIIQDAPGRYVMCHRFDCRDLVSVRDLHIAVVGQICSQPEYIMTSHEHNTESRDASYDVCHHHIFMFTRCEGLRPSARHFLNCLRTVLHSFDSRHDNVTVVFTTYRKFPAIKEMKIVEVGMLTDVYDVTLLLQQCAPRVDVQQYVGLCRKLFCLPGPIMHFARKYLCDLEDLPNPHELEEMVSNDSRFLSEIFEQSARWIKRWISDKDLSVLYYFSSNFGVTFTLEHLQNIHDVHSHHDASLLWAWFLQRQRHNYVIWSVADTRGWDVTDNQRFAVHPLLVYYRKTCLVKETRVIHDQSYNSCTQFLCQVLMKAEENIRLHGRRGEVYGCLASLWPQVKHMLEKAVHCQEGTLDTFIQVSVKARRLIMLTFPNESKPFYRALYESAAKYSTRQKAAVMAAFLGHILAFGQGINFQESLSLLESSLETLQEVGPTCVLKFVLRRKAIILYRQTRYQQSLEYFEQAKNAVSEVDDETDEMSFFGAEINQEEVTAMIYEPFPLIYRGLPGDSKLALKQFKQVLGNIDDLCPNHSELPKLLSSIGLVYQRGFKDVNRALKWFIRSYNERLHLEKITPVIVFDALINITSIFLSTGNLGKALTYCNRALDLHRNYAWRHGDTALALTFLSEIHFNMRNVTEALNCACVAEKLMQERNPQHNYRLRISLNILHFQMMMSQLQAFPCLTEFSSLEKKGNQTFPQEADIVPPLLKSCSDCLSSTLQLGKTMQASLNSEGHHYMLSVYEHAMLLTWQNTDQLTYYKTQMLNYVQENTGLKNLLLDSKGNNELASQHKSLYFYIKDTESDNLCFETFVSLLGSSCQTCTYARQYYGEGVWEMFGPSKQQKCKVAAVTLHEELNHSLTSDIRTPEFSSFSSLGSDLETYRSVLQAHGSVLQAHGSVLQAHGSVLQAHGSVLQAQGSVLQAHGSVLQTHGSVLQAHGSELQEYGSDHHPLASDRLCRPCEDLVVRATDTNMRSLGCLHAKCQALGTLYESFSSSSEHDLDDMSLRPDQTKPNNDQH